MSDNYNQEQSEFYEIVHGRGINEDVDKGEDEDVDKGEDEAVDKGEDEDEDDDGHNDQPPKEDEPHNGFENYQYHYYEEGELEQNVYYHEVDVPPPYHQEPNEYHNDQPPLMEDEANNNNGFENHPYNEEGEGECNEKGELEPSIDNLEGHVPPPFAEVIEEYGEEAPIDPFVECSNQQKQIIANCCAKMIAESSENHKNLKDFCIAYAWALDEYYHLYEQHIAQYQEHIVEFPEYAIEDWKGHVQEAFREACDQMKQIVQNLYVNFASESDPLKLWHLFNAYKEALIIFNQLKHELLEKFYEDCENPPEVAMEDFKQQIEEAIINNPKSTEGFADVVGVDILRMFLDWPEGRVKFREFLQLEFSVENIDFLSEVETYKLLLMNGKGAQAIQMMNRIVTKYILPEAKFAINLPYDISTKLQEVPQNPIDDHHFDAAEKEILNLMRNDSFRRFKVHPTHAPLWNTFLVTQWRELLINTLFHH